MPIKLLMTSCQSASDIIAMHGVDKDIFQKFRDYDVSPDAVKAFKADTSGALVGNMIARRYGWKTGQNIVLKELDGISFNISGIFTTDGSADDFLILAGRKFLQEAKDEQGISNRVMIRLIPGADPDAASIAIDALPLSVTTTTQREETFMSASIDQLKDMVTISRIIIVVIIAVILIAMGNAISMTTLERTREFGILRTLGFKRAGILGMVISEGAIQALVGAVIGCVIVQTIISANLVKSVSTCGITITMTAGPSVWMIGIGIICLGGLLGSILPAWRASRLEIVTAIAHEE
ncbi:MAG: FtsX-like permease family protein [Phycisphaerales bacterium]|jgi:putative ABC transport system permease protein|nr:FtsX-like permease family protein [Phycisphaerales bacterium]